jgi:hypothetical protein
MKPTKAFGTPPVTPSPQVPNCGGASVMVVPPPNRTPLT